MGRRKGQRPGGRGEEEETGREVGGKGQRLWGAGGGEKVQVAGVQEGCRGKKWGVEGKGAA